MNPTILRTILTVLFFAHGIGHGVLVSLVAFSSEKWHVRCWLFDPLLGEK